MRLETSDPEHCDEHGSLVLAHSATIGEIHFGVVEGISLSLTHGYSGITHVISHPVVQEPYFPILVSDTFENLTYLLLHLRSRHETAVILIHSAEPLGLILPTISRGQHQLRSHIKEIDHIRFPLERPRVGDTERQQLPVAVNPGGGVALALIELILDIFVPWHIQGINLGYGRIGYPERHDIIEIASHRRNESLILIRKRGKKGIGETLLVDPIVDYISWIESSNLCHDLPGSPIDGSCWSGIVTDGLEVNIPDGAVSLIDLDLLKHRQGGKRVIVILKDPMCQGSGLGLDLYDLADIETARS